MSVDVKKLKNHLTIDLKDDKSKDRAFEQYKMLADSRNKTLDVRLQSNNFWTTVNGAAISAVSYIKDLNSLSAAHKSSVLWTLIIVGICICISWLNYLWTISQQLEAKNSLLIELEKYFPVPLFKNVFSSIQDKPAKTTLTFKEMLMPSLFILGYLFFAAMLAIIPREVISPA